MDSLDWKYRLYALSPDFCLGKLNNPLPYDHSIFIESNKITITIINIIDSNLVTDERSVKVYLLLSSPAVLTGLTGRLEGCVTVLS